MSVLIPGDFLNNSVEIYSVQRHFGIRRTSEWVSVFTRGLERIGRVGNPSDSNPAFINSLNKKILRILFPPVAAYPFEFFGCREVGESPRNIFFVLRWTTKPVHFFGVYIDSEQCAIADVGNVIPVLAYPGINASTAGLNEFWNLDGLTQLLGQRL